MCSAFSRHSIAPLIAILFLFLFLAVACSEEEKGTTVQGDLSLLEPANGSTVGLKKITLKGLAPPDAEVRRDIRLGGDDSIQTDSSGHWQYDVDLDEGENNFEFFLQDNKDTRLEVKLFYNPELTSGSPTPTIAAEPTQTEVPETAQPTAAPVTEPPATAPPTEPPQAGVEITSVVGGPPNSNASVTVQTAPGTSCSIRYTTPSGTDSTAAGLETHTADSSGVASWTWKIGGSTNAGTGSIRVTCDGVSATADIQIG